MSLTHGFQWSHKDIQLTGFSIAGITTSVAYPAADVCFDVGQGLPFQVPIRNIALTHGHLDHASGLPYLLGQKAMHGVPAPRVYVPEALRDPLLKIIDLWAEIEDHSYNFNMEALGPGEQRILKGKYVLSSFPTFHRVPSQGYTVALRKKRLKAEFQGAARERIVAVRREGLDVEETYDVPQVSFTGDTRIEVLDHKIVRQSRVLVIECTYFDERRSVQQAREWGHIHLDEIIPRLGELDCEKIVLIHSSARYRKDQILKIMDERIPAAHRDRVELFPRYQ